MSRCTVPLCKSWLQDLRLIPIPKLSARFPIFFNVISRARIGKDLPNFGCVFAKNRRDQFFAFWCERHDADAPILRTLDPAYQAPFDEAVNGRADRARRKVHFWPDRIHRQGPFVEECFQYPEVSIID